MGPQAATFEGTLRPEEADCKGSAAITKIPVDEKERDRKKNEQGLHHGSVRKREVEKGRSDGEEDHFPEQVSLKKHK